MRIKELDARISDLEMELARLKEERFVKTAVSFESLLKRERRTFNERIFRGLDNDIVYSYLYRYYPRPKDADYNYSYRDALYNDLMKTAIVSVMDSFDVPFENTTYEERIAIRENMVYLIDQKYLEISNWTP